MSREDVYSEIINTCREIMEKAKSAQASGDTMGAFILFGSGLFRIEGICVGAKAMEKPEEN